MKLSDVMSAMQLSSYAELGLLLFLFAFVLVTVDVLRRTHKELESAERLPLDDEQSEAKRKEKFS